MDFDRFFTESLDALKAENRQREAVQKAKEDTEAKMATLYASQVQALKKQTEDAVAAKTALEQANYAKAQEEAVKNNNMALSLLLAGSGLQG